MGPAGHQTSARSVRDLVARERERAREGTPCLPLGSHVCVHRGRDTHKWAYKTP